VKINNLADGAMAPTRGSSKGGVVGVQIQNFLTGEARNNQHRHKSAFGHINT